MLSVFGRFKEKKIRLLFRCAYFQTFISQPHWGLLKTKEHKKKNIFDSKCLLYEVRKFWITYISINCKNIHKT